MSRVNNRSRTATLAILALFAVLVMLLPGMALAQDDPVVEEDMVVGVVEIAPDGTITVNGIVVDYTDVELPSPLNSGDLVIVTGIFVDETTIRATSFVLFDDDEDMDDGETDDDGEMVDDTCADADHPLALRIGDAFEVDPADVMAMHCDGNGFGNIVRAYLLAEAGEDGMTAEDFLALHHGGMGWGNIVRESEVDPSDLAPGQIRNRNQEENTGDTAPGNSGNAPGHTNNPGNGNSNSNAGGNGNGNGNSNSHAGGNGNGNAGGNGNGNGRGN
ncbi:MAG: hypothetical protein KC547_13625 [Anaerolineae bacterium]|nr:hypothetical protein [Anaerolineae bacterium]